MITSRCGSSCSATVTSAVVPSSETTNAGAPNATVTEPSTLWSASSDTPEYFRETGTEPSSALVAGIRSPKPEGGPPTSTLMPSASKSVSCTR